MFQQGALNERQTFEMHCADKEVSVTEATIGDLEDLVTVVTDCANWLAENGMDHWKDYYTREQLMEKLQSTTSKTYLIYEDDVPVATISLDTQAPHYYVDNDEGENHLEKFSNSNAAALYIMALGVRPSYQGRSYAKILVQFAEERVRATGAQYVRFDARGDYTKLIKFYKKLGFIDVGELPDVPCPYVLFEKEIV